MALLLWARFALLATLAALVAACVWAGSGEHDE
jgi:hypothetical protein